MTSYKLKTPVEHGGTTYTTLTFRKATLGDLMISDKFEGSLSKNIAILSAISDTPMQAFKKILSDDLDGILAATGELLGESQATADDGSM